MKKFVLALLMLAFVGFGVVFFRQYEENRLFDLRGQQNFLKQQLADSQQKNDQLKADGDIKTDKWKQLCDPVSSYCFKFPETWKLDGGTADKNKSVSATITSPDGKLKVTYLSPQPKDVTYLSSHIIKKPEFKVGDTTLIAYGAYPVSSGVYSPSFYLVNESDERLDKTEEGKVGYGLAYPRFDIGNAKAVQLQVAYSGAKMTSEDQAKAWFDSVDGKTAQAIVSSFSAKK